ncbi:MAG: UDP-2,3-diacylglucosamine diphosphatase LpxI [Elusimicrobiota bacterium]|jgi:DUF1009 family protein|nr:UDP-2,3-diacylglucosamine diphosphatase LpxI [Elusimicrobiota bacterium]
MTNNDNGRLGIIAGEGKFPVLIAKEAKAKGIAVYVLGVKGNTDMSAFDGLAERSIVLKLGQLGRAIDFMKENGVCRAVMAGRVQHVNIFSVMPDLRAAKTLARAKDMRPKTILSAAIEEFRKEGIEFASSALFLERFLPPKGVLTKRAPTAEEEKSIELGFKISKTLAALDVGLTSVLCDRAAIAVEGMEGTDNCIKRAGELYRSSQNAVKKAPIVVVKVARPGQDDRYDLPVIGKGTVRTMVEAGARALAVEAGKTLILDLEEVIELANKNDIAITAV